MEKVIEVAKWIFANGPMIIAALLAVLTALVGLFLLRLSF
jgi:hypothetical protein